MEQVYDKIDDLIKEYEEIFLMDLKETRKETMDAISKAKIDMNLDKFSKDYKEDQKEKNEEDKMKLE